MENNIVKRTMDGLRGVVYYWNKPHQKIDFNEDILAQLAEQNYKILNGYYNDLQSRPISTNPTVTLCITCKNHYTFLNRALYSAINQTHKDLEIILITNDSNVEYERCKSMYERLGVRVEFLTEVGGEWPPRAYGISISNGKYVTFLDADDAILPNHIEILYNIMEENKSLNYVVPSSTGLLEDNIDDLANSDGEIIPTEECKKFFFNGGAYAYNGCVIAAFYKKTFIELYLDKLIGLVDLGDLFFAKSEGVECATYVEPTYLYSYHTKWYFSFDNYIPVKI